MPWLPACRRFVRSHFTPSEREGGRRERHFEFTCHLYLPPAVMLPSPFSLNMGICTEARLLALSQVEIVQTRGNDLGIRCGSSLEESGGRDHATFRSRAS